MKLLPRVITLAVIFSVCAVAGMLAYATFGEREYPTAQTRVVIPAGATFDDVLAILRGDRVIAHRTPMHVLARLLGEETKVRAGEYRFPPHETTAEVLDELVTQGNAVARWVRIPEGFTDAQIAQQLQSSGIGSASHYAHAFATDSLVVDGVRTKSLEGELFPDTYLVPVAATPQQVEAQLESRFFARLPRNAAQLAHGLHVSVPQVVIVASLVEREAKLDRDRPLIAGVIYNRLRAGMPLEIDATIEYALPQHKTELSRADLAIRSPYNSYLHTGLPPTPIANPGAASLEAAFHPAATKALYYVYCGKGRHVFARTLAEHEANVARCLK